MLFCAVAGTPLVKVCFPSSKFWKKLQFAVFSIIVPIELTSVQPVFVHVVWFIAAVPFVVTAAAGSVAVLSRILYQTASTAFASVNVPSMPEVVSFNALVPVALAIGFEIASVGAVVSTVDVYSCELTVFPTTSLRVRIYFYVPSDGFAAFKGRCTVHSPFSGTAIACAAYVTVPFNVSIIVRAGLPSPVASPFESLAVPDRV